MYSCDPMAFSLPSREMQSDTQTYIHYSTVGSTRQVFVTVSELCSTLYYSTNSINIVKLCAYCIVSKFMCTITICLCWTNGSMCTLCQTVQFLMHFFFCRQQFERTSWLELAYNFLRTHWIYRWMKIWTSLNELNQIVCITCTLRLQKRACYLGWIQLKNCVLV